MMPLSVTASIEPAPAETYFTELARASLAEQLGFVGAYRRGSP